MTEFRLSELMHGIDDELLMRARQPVPKHKKASFRISMIAAVAAMLLIATLLGAPLVITLSYGASHPEIEGGLVYVMDAMISDEQHFLSSLLPEGVKNTLGSAFDAFKGGPDPSGTETGTETDTATETQAETEIETEPEFVMPPASQGLEFTRNETNDGYTLTGIGSCKDTVIVIPAEYNGLPVTEIYFNQYTGAFENNTELTGVIIPGSVKTIGKRSFYGCTALQEVYIMDGDLQTIDASAFEKCTALQSFTIPNSVTHVSDIPIQESGLTKYDNALYVGNTDNPYLVLLRATDTAITSCEIHPDTKIIARAAFLSCESLQSIDIPEGVITIGYMAFAYTKSLANLTLPQSLRFVGATAFSQCAACTEYDYATYMGTTSNPYAILLWGDYLISVHNDTQYIADGAFSGATVQIDRKGLTIPASVRYIGTNAFACYNKLGGETLTILGDDCWIAEHAFRELHAQNLVIGAGVTHIEQGAFWYTDYRLQSITVQSDNPTYTAIGNCLIDTTTQTLLLACKGSVVPNDQSIKHIGANAFSMNDKIDGTVIPDGVISIGPLAFTIYSGNITVPESVQRIAESAFGSGSINYNGSKQQWEAIAHPSAGSGNYTVHCSDGELIFSDDE